MPIYKPSELHQLGIQPKRRFSQNFLIDRNILEKICKAANVQEGDPILEIGPGPGALTEALLQKGALVIAVEKDKELAEKLCRLETKNHLKIICDDALTFPLEDIPKNTKVIANLPYHITTPILERFINRSQQINSLTVMVQEEVGRRICAEPGTSNYSSITVFLNSYSTPRYCFTVKPNSFFPAPSVYSCVLHLPLKPFPFSFSPDAFFTLTRKAFGQRRKMLRSSLKELLPSDQIEAVLMEMHLKPTARPQELSLAEFAAFFEKCENQKKNFLAE